ncbi:MAG: M28 family metallopeptidase [Planctomycetes bacterium]|nr:M28 family metallopeptidase [Planctomycetota bacterium]
MKTEICLFVTGLAALCVCFPASALAEGVLGFSPERADQHLALEARYEGLLTAENLRDWMQRMTVRPHHAGSPQAKANAEFVAGLFESWGYDTEIETFHVLFPTPRVRELRQLKPVPITASLTEEIADQDSAAEALRREALPPFNAYAADGDVTGVLVYVNQGLPRDYEELERHGIDVEGKIVIARYGGSWRGIKPKVATEKGAIGCIIYNDPRADGYARGDAYPQGAFKHASAVQRGSVLDLPVRPGDPLTPNYGATEDADRLSIKDSETIMTIPVLPISWADAEPLMRTLDGPVAPQDWRGALPLTYRLGGGGGTVVHLKTEFNWDLAPAYNVIARLDGSESPDEWVIRGNHHDAWVIGARDPMSGLVSLMEQARAFAELTKTGWRPKRTMVFCVWDAEEPGLLGSTEWAEHHAVELREKAVAYINTDSNARGLLSMGGSHSLETLAAQVAHEVTDPQTGVSVSERRRAYRLVKGTADQKKEARDRKDLRLTALGSGSDYSVFLQHLGIPSMNVSFGGEGRGGEYHTSFDTFDHFSEFIDPTYAYGVALANVCGRLSLRLLDAEVLPFDFAAAAETISKYADEVVELADTMREETEQHNSLVEENRFALAADPTKTYVAPDAKDPVPHLNFAPLLNASNRLTTVADTYGVVIQPVLDGERALGRNKRAALDRILYRSEQALTREEGLPRRPWFRHQIYAPGFYTGYGAKTLPGIREGIEERHWDETQKQIHKAAESIEKFADAIDSAIALLRK